MAGILTSLLSFPLAPVRGVVSLARVVQREVDQELYGGRSHRRRLEEIDDAARSGDISEADRDDAQRAILDRLAQPPKPRP